MTIKEHLDALNAYLDPVRVNEEQTAISEAFAGRPGFYKAHYKEGEKEGTRDIDYNSPEFRLMAIDCFVNRIGSQLGMIKIDGEFPEIPRRNMGLDKQLTDLDILSTIRIAATVKDKISLEQWQAGERGDLAEKYDALQRDYIAFRDALTVAMQN